MAKYVKTEHGYREIETTVAPMINQKIETAVPPMINQKIETAVPPMINQKIETAVQPMINQKMNANNPVGTGSFSMGRKIGTLIGAKSHAEGYYTTASGENSHAEGYYTEASGKNSHAEGDNTTANGENSHAEGLDTTASGLNSHAEGNGTSANGLNSHAEGKYNRIDTKGKYAHIVGNGTSNSARSNAHTLDWNGVPWYQGRPQFGGTAMDNGSQTVMANGDKEIILTSSTANSTKKFKITVDDSGALTATEITQ